MFSHQPRMKVYAISHNRERRAFLRRQFNQSELHIIAAVRDVERRWDDFFATPLPALVSSHGKHAGVGGFRDHAKKIYSRAELSLLLTAASIMRKIVTTGDAISFIVEDDIEMHDLSPLDIAREATSDSQMSS